MADSQQKIAVDVLQTKVKELIEERVETRRKLLEESAHCAELDRDIAGCVAGARALGVDLDVSSPVSIPQAKQQFFNQFHSYYTNMSNLYATLKAEFLVEDADGADIVDDSRQEMPRIADIIVERLKAAGDDGTKAADIRRYIYRTYKSDIHEKTVGMTLNRMQLAGQVRRDGRTWFLVGEK